jgi:hypothetical protein
VRHRSVLFLTIIAAVTAMSSAASAGGWGWGGCGWSGWGGCGWGWGGCGGWGGWGGCVPAYYANGLIARDATPFYLVNQGPFYSGPGIVTYPVYAARSYPYVGGCGYGYGGCYGVSYTGPARYYDGPRYHHHTNVHYRGPKHPAYRMKRPHHPQPLPPK